MDKSLTKITKEVTLQQKKSAIPLEVRLAATLALLALLSGMLRERVAYYAEILNLGNRLPYADQLLLAGAVFFAAIALLITWKPEVFMAVYRLRNCLGWIRLVLGLLAAASVSWLFVYSSYSLRFDGLFTRALIFSAAAFLTSFLFTGSREHPFEWQPTLAGLLVFGSVFVLVHAGRVVVDHPFPLSWSEGNRFYDYSVLFGRRLYSYPETLPLNAFIDMGRQSLWGLPFLFSDISIWTMRLWSQILFTIPYFLIGWILLRQNKSTNELGRFVPLIFGLWSLLLLNTGPIYTPLILAGILVILTRRSPLWLAVVAVLIASYYARTSRFTWLFAPGMWAVLLAFLDSSQASRQRWVRSTVLGLCGILGGYFLQPMLNGLLASGSLSISSGGLDPTSLSQIVENQPLLWERLLPSQTFSLGVLPALALAAGPAAALIVYAIIKRRWKLDTWQILYLAAMNAAFLGVGIVISVKIGGGSNLHNLDMFLIGLVLAAGLLLETREKDWLFRPAGLPRWGQLLLLFAMLYPATLNMLTVKPLNLPPDEYIEQAVSSSREIVQQYSANGQVLFLDQRQLLTFGYIQHVPLITEYEKKLVMEMAMQSQESYFDVFYKDLAEHRFSLIISEPLYTGFQEETYQFGNENNAWVKWVSIPMLCYYEPVLTYHELGIQFLAPKEKAPPAAGLSCPAY
jgi:hypothetical protein